MTVVIVLVVALLVERFFDWSHLRVWGWYTSILRMVSQKMTGVPPYAILAATIVPLVLASVIVSYSLYGMLYGVLWIAFEVAVVIYCLGASNLWAGTMVAINSFGGKSDKADTDKLDELFEVEVNESGEELHKRITQQIFVAANNRVYAVIFWYCILGVAGALLYRLVSLSGNTHDGDAISEPELNKASQTLQAILDWVPVRIFTFLFALGGNFSGVLSAWIKNVYLGMEGNEILLTECGEAALSDDAKKLTDGGMEQQALNLIDRALVISLVIITLAFVI